MLSKLGTFVRLSPYSIISISLIGLRIDLLRLQDYFVAVVKATSKIPNICVLSVNFVWSYHA